MSSNGEHGLLPRHLDPYVAWRDPLPDVPLSTRETALLVVDMQYGSAHPDYGPLKRARELGYEAQTEYYRRRLELIVPNVRRLQDAFRARGMEVIHTHIQSLTPDGRDRSLEHKLLKNLKLPGSREARILDEVAPIDGEVVIPKTASSVFNATNIHYILGNLGIRNLVICGVVTTGCVETAARDAADLSYRVVLVEDACAAVVEEMHTASIRALRDVYAKIKSTDEVIAALEPVPVAALTR